MKTKYQWKMDGFFQKVGFDVEGMQITQHIAENIFQLDPPPPELSENTQANDYILKALETKDLRYFSFFLHKIEKRLNRYIRRTLVSEGSFRYDPEGFLEIKLCCMMCLLQLLPKYEPGKDAEFMTYAHNFIFDSIRSYQMGKESWSLPSLTTYKKIRTASWMQNNLENAVEAFMEKYKCRRKTADRFFREASCLHRRKETIFLDDEEEEQDILEELAGEEADDMSEIIWHEIHANAVRKAFDRLASDEKEYLQRRNAVCMKCGCARNMKYGESFDDLGAHFELTTAGGAEKAYRKAVDHLTRLLVEDNAIGAVTIRKKKVIRRKKKIAVAVYKYQADYDGEWGEIEIDFEKGTGKILYIAELDTTRSHKFANRAIEEILNSDLDDLPKQKTIAFPK